MNIFYLDKDPKIAAKYHLDKHVVKMIVEYAQLMSTAHRLLDGESKTVNLTPSEYEAYKAQGFDGKSSHSAILLKGEQIVLENFKWTITNKQAMAATHANHPSAIWVRESADHYKWLYELFIALCEEKEYRYPNGSNETFTKYGEFLANPPVNIPKNGFSVLPLAMPVEFKPDGLQATTFDEAVLAYRRFYIGDKFRFSKWTNRDIPSWFFQDLARVWKNDTLEKINYLLDDQLAKKTHITMDHVKKYLFNL